MSCPGLHCPGCSGGQSLGVLAALIVGLVVAYKTIAVVAENIIPIAAVTVACFALSVAASVWLERRSDRRGVAWGRARGIYSRADYIEPVKCVPRITDGERPAIAPPPQVVFNIFGPLDAEQARIIRQAINGRTEP